MPHTIHWQDSDWQYALDSLELVARTSREDAPVSLWGELRLREQQMGATLASRMGLRLRYVAPVADSDDGGSITALDDYCDL